ncbi:PREDICTED: probable (S)-N-methylcoclaurine 3'-hydroxylase isozyme 2 [Nelumbo nucifera]|uniref:(S)-N-methylcoclaurine 3'-hydroxylase isozyme 2 n=2 Tax=Nelumbo nucifera TaxID=4432 RepID=A0A822Z1D9_NELNU|nr:PREDICTED: probable (S)-N-methylcoclaurine 3'-hydroxylase isozyme 2 [Nelumbo nucifera]WEE66563.1 3'-hydroxylase-like protein [Nelumbo nucifera]DAD37491.1 TPA_asm: hypothetical protein HUJ06_008132 [Nelumbo nucifera]
MEIMAQAALAGEVINLLFPVFLSLCLFFLFIKLIKSASSATGPPLPPGPHPWPVVGNIFRLGRKPHVRLSQLAQVHGPLMSLSLGRQLIVVASSPATATQILKTHDKILCGRYAPVSSRRNDQLKYLDNFLWTELFSTRAIDSQAALREKKVRELIRYLGSKEGEVVNIGEVMFATVFNILCNLFLSKDFISLEDDEIMKGGIKRLLRSISEVASTPNLADLFPILGPLDIQGLNKKARELFVKITAMWEDIIKERREAQSAGGHVSRQRDLLDVLIDNNFSDDQINNLLLKLFTAGTHTSSSTIEWAMAEMMKNQESLVKARIELAREIKRENQVREADLCNLVYLNACLKETLRLHPPAPFLLPHRAIKTCTVMNYTIPKDSQVFVNVWAIGRDSMAWSNPLSFNPERFLSSNLGFMGNNFEFIPFGAGRRICPGLPMAGKQIQLIMASLIYCCNWSLPNGTHPSTLNMNDKLGVVLQREQPLLLIPKLRRRNY